MNDPNSPGPNGWKPFIGVIAGIMIAGLIMSHISTPALEWASEKIGVGYRTLVQPAVAMTQQGALRLLPILLHNP